MGEIGKNGGWFGCLESELWLVGNVANRGVCRGVGIILVIVMEWDTSKDVVLYRRS